VSLSNFGKLLIALTEFEKGVAFIGCAMVLEKKAQIEPHQYVSLHLLAQGIELLVKGSLYGHDYNAYKKTGRKFGHDLEKAYSVAETAFRLKPLRPDCDKQFKQLSALYRSHSLRYAGVRDIFRMPSSIDVSAVNFRIKCAIRLGRREFEKAFAEKSAS
jgi:hypothetical protein